MKVYLDNAATTALYPEVVEAVTETLKNCFGNPSSTHSFGRTAKTLVESARKSIAGHLGASAQEIIFTSGGTEADNLILQGCVRHLGVKHIITSPLEHHAVLHTTEALEKEFGIQVSLVAHKENSEVDYTDLEKLLSNSQDKTLVSLMHINNEIGTKLDLYKVGQLCKTHQALFHSDTVQSVAHYPLDFSQLPVDFAVAAAHKFHGPKGTGFAFVRKSTGLQPLILGGEQERGMRAGTECVHNIVGMAKALELGLQHLEKDVAHITRLKKRLIEKINREIKGIVFNGCSDDFEKSTYNLCNLRLPVDEKKGTMLLFQLDLNGVACSKGSACQSGSDKGSHVLNALLKEEELKNPSIRLSFSALNTEEEIDYTVGVLKKFVS